MAEQQRGGQYDDDLTVGLEEIADESFDTGYVDLFEYAGDEESVISRLKTIMLSIEWEITDEVLISFNDELQAAEREWAEDQVKLVYIQALQKISRYIYQKKSDAHHNAMKVMISFFYDLEKIVLDSTISEEEKRTILKDDVQKFELLKQQLGFRPERAVGATVEMGGEAVTAPSVPAGRSTGETNPDLYNLKAHILGIDWEISDRDLTEISKEVKLLQEKWSTSKAEMMLLKGIDALGGYIKLMKHQSHADSFKLLNSFYHALEVVVDQNLGYQETKQLLLSEAGKFSLFKERISGSITPEAIAEQKRRLEAGVDLEPPAGDVGSDDTLDLDSTSEFEQTTLEEDIGSEEDFTEETLEKVTSFFGDLDAAASSDFAALSAEEALRGVDVESDADEVDDEDALPTLGDGMIAPALAGLEDDSPAPVAAGFDSPAPAGAEFESPAAAVAEFDSPADVLQGVDVETDADDDSKEAPLPFDDGEPAPALSGGEDSEMINYGDGEEEDEGDINRHVDDFFASEMFGEDDGGVDGQLSPVGDDFAPALSGVDVDDEGDDFEEEPDFAGGAPAPALSGFDAVAEESFDGESDSDDIDIEGSLDAFLSEDSDFAPAGPAVVEVDIDSDASGQFSDLVTSFEALKTDISELNLTAIKSAVDGVKEELITKPIEKTLVHLIGTVAGTIVPHPGATDDDAVALMQSVFEDLQQIRSTAVDLDQALQLLSGNTEKILQWQQQRLSN